MVCNGAWFVMEHGFERFIAHIFGKEEELGEA
jgi:hypothetical protein